MQAIDLDMLADDIGDLLAKHHGIDACDDDIRPHLDQLIANIQTSIADRADGEPAGSDAATWTADDDTDPTPQSGRRPRVNYIDWHRSQLVNLGANTPDDWYWQCPTVGCKVWAGPYGDPTAAKQAGFEHVYKCEKTDYYRRGRRP